TIFLCTLLLCTGSTLVAQGLGQRAIQNLQSDFVEFGLTAEDVMEIRVQDDFISNGIQHVYLQQYYNGLPVFNGIAGLHFKNGNLVYRTSSFSTGFAAQPSSTPTVDPTNALVTAASPLDITLSTSPRLIENQGNRFVYNWPAVSNDPIFAQLIFTQKDEQLFLVWQFDVNQINTPDHWLIQVDAIAGNILTRYNQTLYCSFTGLQNHNHKAHRHQASCQHSHALNENLPTHIATLEKMLVGGGSYNVFPFGIESPTYGGREIIESPADPVASPFGWHDTNGAEGPEHTITRGNNVWAYTDIDADNQPDSDNVIDGGDSLVFNFFYEDLQQPDTLIPAAVSQLFYMNNMIHDFTYHHGFDEPSGNFQQNNYGNGGVGNDAVRAEAQDGSGTNNANFSTPVDGGSGRMQMFLWENSGAAGFITVDAPANIAGDVESGAALFGPQTLEEPVTGAVAIAIDGTTNPELVCEAVTNSDEVKGKIALIRRGECFFEQKVLNAQAAEAIAVIICNPENTILNMAGGVDDDEPVIPSALIRESDCAEIRASIAAGDSVFVTFPAVEETPPVDGDFDNGIVAHEYGHGISNRTVGGPGNTSCLFNTEQMGEGWSDFFSLVTSPLNGAESFPNGAEPRGIGNYAIGRGPTGGGIRRQPYSNDMTVNDQVYDDIITSGIPHPLGEIWCGTLWDLYWAMVDEYGFDSNLITGTGGNNLAVELVIEGMKNTACTPGMVDGRDGILIADLLLNDGANQCLIWEVFARRGLGYLADQGSGDSQIDGVENFEILPSCFRTVKLSKSVDSLTIIAGSNVTFTLTVTNDKEEDITGVDVTDELPEGLTIDPASITGTNNFTINDGSITFNLGTLSPEEERTITYTVSTSPELRSIQLFFDGAEEGDDNWEIFPINATGTFIWEQSDVQPFEGDLVWFVANVEEANDQVLQTSDPILLDGTAPAIRFYTQYDLEAGWDGGIVEMSTDGVNWSNVGLDRFLRGEYRGEVATSAFSESVGDFNAYWGTTDDYFDAVLDFSDMAGQAVYLRWRFGSDAEAANTGWWVDNIELLDLFRYNGQATLTDNEGDTAEAIAGDGGVIVDIDFNSDVVDPRLGLTSVDVYPNPADEIVNVSITSQLGGDVTVQLLSVDGRLLQNHSLDLVSGAQSLSMVTSELPAGVYLIQVLGADRIHTEKVTIQ
ncbi:MAG: M36 family metallopeptidase, partial [Bacteroidota bacterium]